MKCYVSVSIYVLLSLTSSIEAFNSPKFCKNRRISPAIPAANTNTKLCSSSKEEEEDKDPTKVWYAGIADNIQKVLTNSPLNEGKKALVKSLAGEYDEVAVANKLNGLIQDEPVLMMSFTK